MNMKNIAVNGLKQGGLLKVFAAASVLQLAVGGGTAVGQSGGDSLKAGFENLHQSSRPQAWWHWTGGNVTEQGITADLEWMHRVGIGRIWMWFSGANMRNYGRGLFPIWMNMGVVLGAGEQGSGIRAQGSGIRSQTGCSAAGRRS